MLVFILFLNIFFFLNFVMSCFRVFYYWKVGYEYWKYMNKLYLLGLIQPSFSPPCKLMLCQAQEPCTVYKGRIGISVPRVQFLKWSPEFLEGHTESYASMKELFAQGTSLCPLGEIVHAGGLNPIQFNGSLGNVLCCMQLGCLNPILFHDNSVA